MKLSKLAAVSIATTFSSTVGAADMIENYNVQDNQRETRYLYVQQAPSQYKHCGELKVEYRPPNTPRKEIVRLCKGYEPQIVARYR